MMSMSKLAQATKRAMLIAHDGQSEVSHFHERLVRRASVAPTLEDLFAAGLDGHEVVRHHNWVAAVLTEDLAHPPGDACKLRNT